MQPRKSDCAEGRAAASSHLKLVLAILCRPEILHEPLRHIASTTGISLGKVSTTLRRLGDLDHIRELGRQWVLHDPPRLLHRWEVSHLEVVRPRLNPTTCLATHTSLDDVKAALLEVAVLLHDCIDDFAVVGGVVPTLLIDAHGLDAQVEAHPGTTDLDLALALSVLDRQQYETIARRLRRSGSHRPSTRTATRRGNAGERRTGNPSPSTS